MASDTYSNTHSFNLENYHLLFLHIKKFRMFEDVLIGLDPQYSFSKTETGYKAISNENYVDLTSQYGLKIKVLCGANGVGKTTILKVLQGAIMHKGEDYEIFWRDVDGNILGTCKTSVEIDGHQYALDHYSHLDSINALCANGAASDDSLKLERRIVEFYSINPKLYDQGNTPLFDGFYVGYDRRGFAFDELGEALAARLKYEHGFNFKNLARASPTFHAFCHIAGDNTFDSVLLEMGRRFKSFEEIFEALADDKLRALDRKVLELIYKSGKPPDTKDLLGQKEIRRFFEISDYERVQAKIAELSEAIDEWLKAKVSTWKVHQWPNALWEIIWFHPYRQHPNGKSELEDLSFGQRLKLRLQFNLTPFIAQENASWFHFDEWDSDLHPEWKRRLIDDIVYTYRESSKSVYKFQGKPKGWSRTMTCIVVTHSPFVLSDLMAENIVLLKEGLNGRTSVESESNARCFAGNIGELFHTEFFMETTIGEFAQSNITAALKELKGKTIEQRRMEIRKLFQNVGDVVLRSLLLEQIDNAENPH